MKAKRFKMRTLTIVVSLALIALIGSCKKEEIRGGSGGGGSQPALMQIVANNIFDAPDGVFDVNAMLYWEVGEDWNNEVIAEAVMENAKFTLDLPSVIDNKFLSLLAEDLEEETLHLSDPTAKASSALEFYLLDEEMDYIGEFYSEDYANNARRMWIYFDRNVSITGSNVEVSEAYNEEYHTSANANMKRGWNILYFVYGYHYDEDSGRDIYTNSLTSVAPSGANFAWYFDDWYGKKQNPKFKAFSKRFKR